MYIPTKSQLDDCPSSGPTFWYKSQLMFVKQCHVPPIFWWFISPMYGKCADGWSHCFTTWWLIPRIGSRFCNLSGLTLLIPLISGSNNIIRGSLGNFRVTIVNGPTWYILVQWFSTHLYPRGTSLPWTSTLPSWSAETFGPSETWSAAAAHLAVEWFLWSKMGKRWGNVYSWMMRKIQI